MQNQKQLNAAKEYLKSYEDAFHRVKRCELRLSEIRLNRIHPPVINDGMPYAHANNDLSSYAVLLEREEKRYAKAKKECRETYEGLVDKIEQLEDEGEKDVLTYRYIKFMKWQDICSQMGYSWQHIHRIHMRALGSLKMRLNETKCDCM